MAGADGTSRIRDVVRDSKILRDTLSQFDKKLEADIDCQQKERVFPRLAVGEHDSYGQECWKHAGITSSIEEVERWFRYSTGKEVSFDGFYDGYGESDSLIARFKRNLPAFDGFWHIEDLLSWIDAIEDFFEEIRPPEHLKCKIVWYKMKGAAYYWWKILQNDRFLEGKNLISSWPTMKRLLLKRFMPATCSTKDTVIEVTTGAENFIKNAGDSTKNDGSDECIACEQSKEEIMVTPARCSSICLLPISKCKQCEKSVCNCPNECYSITPDTSINATTETENRVKIEVTKDCKSNGTDVSHVTFENDYTLAFAQLDVAKNWVPRVQEHCGVYEDAGATTIKCVVQAMTATKRWLEEGSDLSNESATNGESTDQIKLASVHTRKEVMKLHANKNPLKLECKITSMSNRQLPTDVYVLPYLPRRFWELIYVAKNQNLKLSPEVEINIRVEEITWLVGVVVILKSLLDDNRNLASLIIGRTAVQAAELRTAAPRGNVQSVDSFVSRVAMFIFDPGDCWIIHQVEDDNEGSYQAALKKFVSQSLACFHSHQDAAVESNIGILGKHFEEFGDLPMACDEIMAEYRNEVNGLGVRGTCLKSEIDAFCCFLNIIMIESLPGERGLDLLIVVLSAANSLKCKLKERLSLRYIREAAFNNLERNLVAFTSAPTVQVVKRDQYVTLIGHTQPINALVREVVMLIFDPGGSWGVSQFKDQVLMPFSFGFGLRKKLVYIEYIHISIVYVSYCYMF